MKAAGVAGATIGLAGGLGGIIAACGKEGDTATTAAGAGTTVAVGAEAGREIKIGFVSPQTGGIASFGVPDKYCMERAVEAIGDGIVCGDGKKHPVKIVIQDSQSDTARAAAVTGDLINNTKVDMIVTASTPDTVNPVATQCEALATPCLSNDCPWQPFVDRANTGDFSVTYKWCYHTFWGLEDVMANFSDMWGQLTTNKKVGATWSNDPDGQAWKGGWGAAFDRPRSYADHPERVHGRRHGLLDPDQPVQGRRLRHRRGHVHPAGLRHLLDPGQPAGLEAEDRQFRQGSAVPRSPGRPWATSRNGLTTEVWWMPTHPFTSSLNGETCQQFADKFEAEDRRPVDPAAAALHHLRDGRGCSQAHH